MDVKRHVVANKSEVTEIFLLQNASKVSIT